MEASVKVAHSSAGRAAGEHCRDCAEELGQASPCHRGSCSNATAGKRAENCPNPRNASGINAFFSILSSTLHQENTKVHSLHPERRIAHRVLKTGTLPSYVPGWSEMGRGYLCLHNNCQIPGEDWPAKPE